MIDLLKKDLCMMSEFTFRFRPGKPSSSLSSRISVSFIGLWCSFVLAAVKIELLLISVDFRSFSGFAGEDLVGEKPAVLNSMLLGTSGIRKEESEESWAGGGSNSGGFIASFLMPFIFLNVLGLSGN